MDPQVTPKKPPLSTRVAPGARVALQLLSCLLCFALFFNLLALMLTADLRQAAGREGFRSLVDSILTSYTQQLQSGKEPRRAAPLSGGTAQEDVELNFLDPNSLVDYTYNIVIKYLGEGSVTKESVRTFLTQSTLKDYLTDKVSSSLSSLLESGEVGELVNSQEIAQLLLENKELLRQCFGGQLTDENIDSIVSVVEDTLEKEDTNAKYVEFVESLVKGEEPIVLGISAQDVLSFISSRLTGRVFWTELSGCLLILVLLCLANFYNIPAGMTWAAIPCILSGGLLALITALMRLPAKLLSMEPVLDTLKQLIAPVHYTVLGIGICLLAASIVWRILRKTSNTR